MADREWINSDLLQRNITAAADAATAYLRRNCLDEAANLVAEWPMASPIEAVFAVWWHSLGRAEEWTVDLIPQREVDVAGRRFRIDFAVMDREVDRAWDAYREFGLDYPNIAIEMDGHDFHERTKEQVALRNERDRLLQTHGWMVLHYSGSEIARDPEKVVRSAYDIVSDAHYRFVRAYNQLRFGARKRSTAAEGAADPQKQTPS